MESNYNSGGSGRTKQLERIRRTLQDKYVRSVGIVAGQLDFPMEKGISYNLHADTTTGFSCTVDLESATIDRVSYSGDYNELINCLDGMQVFLKDSEMLLKYVELLEENDD